MATPLQTTTKRPLLPAEDRARLRAMAAKASRHKEERTSSNAYAQGVTDLLAWIIGDDPTPLLREVAF